MTPTIQGPLVLDQMSVGNVLFIKSLTPLNTAEALEPKQLKNERCILKRLAYVLDVVLQANTMPKIA